MRTLLVLVSVTLFLLPPQRGYSPIQDGEAHGDPPYLVEDGWEPLLNRTGSNRLESVRPECQE